MNCSPKKWHLFSILQLETVRVIDIVQYLFDYLWYLAYSSWWWKTIVIWIQSKNDIMSRQNKSVPHLDKYSNRCWSLFKSSPYSPFCICKIATIRCTVKWFMRFLGLENARPHQQLQIISPKLSLFAAFPWDLDEISSLYSFLHVQIV